jgi:hypothetical protein
MPYLIGSSQPVFSPDGKYMYLASAANEVLTFSKLSDAYFKPRETKTVPAGMYRVDIATSEIKLLVLLSLERETATSVVISSDGKTLYYNNFHAVYGIHLDTGEGFVLCGKRDTFGKANGKAEDARLVLYFLSSYCILCVYEFAENSRILVRRVKRARMQGVSCVWHMHTMHIVYACMYACVCVCMYTDHFDHSLVSHSPPSLSVSMKRPSLSMSMKRPSLSMSMKRALFCCI